ncbi:MAG: acyltransferase [Spirosomataceae bacterium]
MAKLIHKVFFRLRAIWVTKIVSSIRRIFYQAQGMRVGNNTYLPKMYVSWPHQVKIGRECRLEENIRFKFDGIWKEGPSIIIGDTVFIGSNCEFNITEKITIGANTLIASGSRFIDHNHGIKLGCIVRNQKCTSSSISIDEDVWIGVNVVVLEGVSIGKGAVVAAGAVVTKSIPENEIWGGVPAKKIGMRK